MKHVTLKVFLVVCVITCLVGGNDFSINAEQTTTAEQTTLKQLTERNVSQAIKVMENTFEISNRIICAMGNTVQVQGNNISLEDSASIANTISKLAESMKTTSEAVKIVIEMKNNIDSIHMKDKK